MIDSLPANTQAILLLTAPLLPGPKSDAAPLLTLGEYNRLARLLRDHRRQPGELVGSSAAEVLALCSTAFERDRLQWLLGRGFLLGQVVHRWTSRSIWVLSRADPKYPERIKTLLKEDSPPILYGCGDVSLLDRASFAIVGSRHATDELIAYTAAIGRLAAPSRLIVSGGAKGVDRAAMDGTLHGGGMVAGVLADSLERASLAPENRQALLEQRLVLLSPYDPSAGFNVGNAMQRNKLIYALADAALVVSSDFEKGGTWAGATEQFDRYHFVPVFVRTGGGERGNAGLIQRGGLPWSEPASSNEFEHTLMNAITMFAVSRPNDLLSHVVHETTNVEDFPNANPRPSIPLSSDIGSKVAAVGAAGSPADVLRASVRALLREEMKTDRTAEEMAERLGVTATQMKAWLSDFAAEGVVKKVSGTKPTRYRFIATGPSPLRA